MFHETSPASYIASTHARPPHPRHRVPTRMHRHGWAATHTRTRTRRLSYSTPSAAIRHLNSRAIPVRLLNTTDWDEWQTSSASVSPLILLVGVALTHLIPRRLPLLRFAPGELAAPSKTQIWRPGGSACWEAYRDDVSATSSRPRVTRSLRWPAAVNYLMNKFPNSCDRSHERKKEKKKFSK